MDGRTFNSARGLGWVTRDAWLIITARAVRTFAQASVTVLLGIYMKELLGFSYVQFGLLVTLGLAGSAVFATGVALMADAVGRRRLLTLFTCLTGAVGLALAFTDQFLLLALVVFLGSFNAAGGGPAGPVQPLEQAALPETVRPEKRTDLFAVYSMVSTGARAVGVLAAALPVVFQNALGLDELTSYRVMFVSFAVMDTLAGLLYALLSPAVEVRLERRRWTNPLALPSRQRIFTMAGLFSLDTFATRLVAQSLVALWFRSRFGIEISSIAFIFFFTDVLHMVSMWLAARMSHRFGLLNTIVFTHVPPVLFVAVLPFMPTATLAAVFWLLRGFFSQMDVPTRQSYTMAVVGSQERIAMAGINNVSQSVLGIPSPSVATLLWSIVGASFPFVASAALKAVYLAGFYLLFRNVRPPEEERQSVQAGTPEAIPKS